MNEDFKTLSQSVMEYISGLGRGKDTKRVYANCFRSLGTYLNEQQLPYSPESAREWLNQAKSKTGKVNFDLYKAAVNKLNDLYYYGEIHVGHSDPEKTNVGRLCPEFKALQQQFLLWLTDRAEATVSNRGSGCTNILLNFQKYGVFNVPGITYELLVKEFFTTADKTYYVKTMHHSNLRFLLRFLHEQYAAPFGYTLFVDAMATKKGYFWNQASPNDITMLHEAMLASDALSLEDFRLMCECLYQEHIQNDYSATALTGIRRITNLFYLFMDMNGLYYTPQVGCVWLDSVTPYLSCIEFKHFRRILCLIEQRFQGKKSPLQSIFVFRETAYLHLPEWCLADVNRFLETKQKEGLTVSTLTMYRSSVCRFCSFLNSRGISSFKTLTASDVKEFNRFDKHRTAAGKNAYNSRIRKFLRFLGETGRLDNPFLFLSLPSACAARESLVITLTEEEQEQLRSIFQSNDNTVSLREKAMIQLGLYMGLRSSDIVSLTIDNIDWENASIRVLQNKTDYEIILPMPTSVANALYRYIMYERPASDTRNIFVRNHAPHTSVSKGACRAALNDALPERKVPGSGFHVTRKTFATNLLRNDVSPQQVAEALGHRDLENVHKYLSLDEERMKQCGLNLSDRGLSMKGGFRNEW